MASLASHAKMPSFDALVANYPMDPAPANVKKMIGGSIDDTTKPMGQQWLGGAQGDTCTIRMSRAFNYAGIHIPSNYPGLRTASGRDHLHYAFAVQEMRSWLTATFGAPGVDVKGKPVSRDAFMKYKGIILFDINFGLNADGRTRAQGHVDLWDTKTFVDETTGQSSPTRDFFEMATRVSLWVAEGLKFLPVPN